MESEVIRGQGKTESAVWKHTFLAYVPYPVEKVQPQKKIIIEQIQGKEGKNRWYATNKINKAKQITKTTGKI